jgi:hypothetical protein
MFSEGGQAKDKGPCRAACDFVLGMQLPLYFFSLAFRFSY